MTIYLFITVYVCFVLCLLLTYSSKHLLSFKKLLQTSGDVDLHPPITADKNKGRGYMTCQSSAVNQCCNLGWERGAFPIDFL